MKANSTSGVRLGLVSLSQPRHNPLPCLYWVIQIYIFVVLLYAHCSLCDYFFETTNWDQIITWAVIHSIVVIFYFWVKMNPGFVIPDLLSDVFFVCK